MKTVPDVSRTAQRKAFKRRFALGLLRPFTDLTFPVRVGEIAHTVLSRWPIPPQPPKPTAKFCYVAVFDRTHWLMLRESMFSLYRSWKELPTITVVSDGSWSAADFYPVFSWWPGRINVFSRKQIIADADAAGERELAQYAEASAYGLKLASIVLLARREPILFVDADILWFRDPTLLLGNPTSWVRPRALRENNCRQRQDMALRYCAQVLQPPFVNSGIVSLYGELMAPALLRSMVQDALPSPLDSSCEQTIIAIAVKLGGEFFPEKLSLVAVDDTYSCFIRNAKDEGYYSRHYVTPARQLLYRDALRLRLDLGKFITRRPQNGNTC
jgi:hypothetical protein